LADPLPGATIRSDVDEHADMRSGSPAAYGQDEPRSRWPWLLCAVAVLLGVTALPLQILARGQASGDVLNVLFLPVGLLMIAGYSAVGAILASRNPRSPIGWILIAVGLAFGLAFFTEGYARYALETNPGSLPSGDVAAWFGTWVYAVMLCGLPLVALLYPDGRVVSPRWRPVPWIVLGCAAAGSLGTALAPGSIEVETGFGVTNPFGIEALGPIFDIVGPIGWMGLFVTIPISIVSLVLRYRRSEGEARQQIRWLVFVALALVSSLLVTLAAALIGGKAFDRSIGPEVAFAVIFSLIALGVPAAIGVAILKYRLYDLDLVIKKTIVFAILVLLLLALTGLGGLLLGGTLIPSLHDRPPLLLLFGAAFGLSVIPAYWLARKVADRVVYGGRASPYEVLSEFSERASETYSTEDVLPRMAQLIGQATGADTARVWLHVGSELRPTAAWPADAIESGSTPTHEGELPDFGDESFEIRHQGELLGALTLEMRPSDPMNPSKERIVRDLASQTGLVLRNVRLIEELRESRRRIVTAQDERARKLERNIHDGAQQQLVALAVKVGLVERLVQADMQKAVAMLGEVKGEANDALENLRDLARGIYPPLLADKGLAAALSAQGRKVPIPVGIEPDGIGRYPQELESAVYFSCLEALQNVAKYARATRAIVRLAHANGALTFEVIDDGVGFDPVTASAGSGLQGIADRLASLGGTVEIRSAPARGTTVAGRIPVTETSR
jgi:signal transduction histidine kinase